MNLKDIYDETSPISIEQYANEIVGKTFEDILAEYFSDDEEGYKAAWENYNSPYRKGSLGNLVEKFYFGLEINNSPEPDFPKAGVELKVTPYEITKTKKIKAGERLVIGMIPNDRPVPASFEESHVYKKLEILLLILYLRDRSKARLEYEINYSHLFSITSEALAKDLEIIKSDYEYIIDMIKSGNAHKLSEGQTMYLGACTKGSTAKSSWRPQYYNKDVDAKSRAFCLKQGYMTSLIKNYVIPNVNTYDAITDEKVTKQEFEEKVLSRIANYQGWSVKELQKEFNLKSLRAKNAYAILTLRMLGVYTENAAEFEKSNTVIKTIRLQEDGKMQEHMSFPAIDLQEFFNADWDEAYINNYFSETRFLFVIYKKYKGEYHLSKAKFWNMPVEDIDNLLYEDWKKYQEEFSKGVSFKKTASQNNIRIYNSLPKASETNIFHLRPHSRKSAYLIKELNYKKGNLKRDADVIPNSNGNMMTKQSFWLNKDYVETII